MSKGKLRWVMLLWLTFVLIVAFMDRVNLAVGASLMLKEFGLSPSSLGLVMSGFTFGYMIFTFFGGFIVQRYSARKVIAVVFVAWSVATFATGLAAGFLSLLIIRILFGMFEGPLVPALNGTVNHWMLNKEKAFSAAIYISAIPFGVVLGNIVSAYIVTGWGWRAVFYTFGIAGVILGIISWIILRDTPKQHPWISKEELKLIEDDYHPPLASDSVTGQTFVQLIKDPKIWLNASYNFFYAFTYWATMNWLPTYFVMERKTTILKSGWMASAPWFFGLVGVLLIGKLADKTGKGFKGNWMMWTQFLSVPFIAYAVVTPSVEICLVCFSVALFLMVGSQGVGSAIIWELWDRADVPKAYGLSVSWMVVAGVIAPWLMGLILEKTQSFALGYYLFAGGAFIAGISAFILHKYEKSNRAMREEKKRAQMATETT